MMMIMSLMMMDNDKDIDVDSQGIRHLGMSPCASENLTVLELDNCPLITDLRCLIIFHHCQNIQSQSQTRNFQKISNLKVKLGIFKKNQQKICAQRARLAEGGKGWGG